MAAPVVLPTARYPPAVEVRLVRFVLLRGLGAIYLVAFLSLAVQVLPLIGSRGLLPAANFLARVAEAGHAARLPGLFWIDVSDPVLVGGAWLGVVLAAVVMFGLANAPMMAALWFLYLSYVHIGQTWYGFGWETLLLEAGFLGIWLAPPWDPRPLGADPAPRWVVFLYRWLVLRLMLGAGLIKLRGDACWRDLTCLDTHFETQPLPNPLSPWFHALPGWVHHGMVGWNHVVELILPLWCLGPRPARLVAGILMIQFQLTLVLSGNLSFLNWLTIVLCLALFDDGHLARVLPGLARRLPAEAVAGPLRRGVVYGVVALVAVLSVQPVRNLLSSEQAMNRSFGAWHLVNTYGAFGSVGSDRDEIILEGTADGVTWREYAFPCKPGDVMRRPCVIAPFQPRLDWEMWFAALQSPEDHPWLVHLMWKLLQGHPEAVALLDGNPFPDTPPIAVRAERYRYRFARGDEPGWWVRERLGPYIRPLSADDPELVELVEARGW